MELLMIAAAFSIVVAILALSPTARAITKETLRYPFRTAVITFENNKIVVLKTEEKSKELVNTPCEQP